MFTYNHYNPSHCDRCTLNAWTSCVQILVWVKMAWRDLLRLGLIVIVMHVNSDNAEIMQRNIEGMPGHRIFTDLLYCMASKTRLTCVAACQRERRCQACSWNAGTCHLSAANATRPLHEAAPDTQHTASHVSTRIYGILLHMKVPGYITSHISTRYTAYWFTCKYQDTLHTASHVSTGTHGILLHM